MDREDKQFLHGNLFLLAKVVVAFFILVAAIRLEQPRILVLILGIEVIDRITFDKLLVVEGEEPEVDVKATLAANGFVEKEEKGKQIFVRKVEETGEAICISVDKRQHTITTWVITADGYPQIVPLPESYLEMLLGVLKWS